MDEEEHLCGIFTAKDLAFRVRLFFPLFLGMRVLRWRADLESRWWGMDLILVRLLLALS